MPFSKHVDFGYYLVAIAPAPAASGTTMTLTPIGGATYPALPFNLTVYPTGTAPLRANAEYVTVTAMAGNAVTAMTRAAYGTTARAIVVGDQVANTLILDDFSELVPFANGNGGIVNNPGPAVGNFLRDDNTFQPVAGGGGNVNAGAALDLGEIVIGQGITDIATTTTGAGVIAALAVNTGSAGAFVVNGGPLGTPTSGGAANLTGLPIGAGTTGTLGPDRGGTGIANNIASTITISGNFAGTFTFTGVTGVTFPTSGTLATTAQLTANPVTSAAVLADLALVVGAGGARGVASSTVSGIPLLTAGAPTASNVTNDVQTKASIMPNTAPPAGTIPVGNAGGTAYAPIAMSGDATLGSTGALTLGVVAPAKGGTGVANNAASTLTISGNFASTFTFTGITGVTFPTSGTLATTAQLTSNPVTAAAVLADLALVVGSGGARGVASSTVSGIPLLTSGVPTASNVTNDAQTKAAILPNTAPAAGEIPVGNAGGTAYAKVALSGDATLASTGALTIAAAAVTLAKMANLAQDQFIGRVTASTGVPETATITAAARTVLDDTTVAAMVDTLGGAAATGTGGIVRATSPTLVTPVLGTVAAGSILTNATGLPPAGQTTAGKVVKLGFGKDGGGSALTTSTIAFAVTVPVDCTLVGYDLSIDAGTITVKFWKIADGTAIPTIANVINTSGVSISSGTHILSTTTSDFTTTAFTAGDIVMCAITAVATATWFSGALRLTKN